MRGPFNLFLPNGDWLTVEERFYNSRLGLTRAPNPPQLGFDDTW